MAQEYQDFLQQHHSTFTTPESTLNKLIKKVTGSEPQTKTRLILGEMNEVYDIRMPEGPDIIVRIGHSWEYRFGAEKWAIEKSKQHGVRVPKIIAAAEEVVEGEKVAISIQEKLAGVPLNTLIEAKDSAWVEKIVTDAGRELAKIHTVETNGFGFLDDQGKGEYQSWAEYMLNYQDQSDKLKSLAQENGIDFSLIEKANITLKDHQPLFEKVKPRLLHTDFSPKHILVDQDQITGLIDFENCKGGDNTFDFGWWDYFHRNPKHLEWLKKGYQELGDLGEDFDLRLKLMKIYFGLMFLEWYAEQKNPNIQHVKDTLVSDLQGF